MRTLALTGGTPYAQSMAKRVPCASAFEGVNLQQPQNIKKFMYEVPLPSSLTDAATTRHWFCLQATSWPD